MVEKPRILECERQGRLRDGAFGLSIWAGSLGEGTCRGRNRERGCEPDRLGYLCGMWGERLWKHRAQQGWYSEGPG